MKRRALREALLALDAAGSLAEWKEAAWEVDFLTGGLEWRKEEESPYYDHHLLKSECEQLRQQREAEEGLLLVQTLTASLYRHLADVAAPELYAVALSGTKELVGRWLGEVEASLRWLAHKKSFLAFLPPKSAIVLSSPGGFLGAQR